LLVTDGWNEAGRKNFISGVGVSGGGKGRMVKRPCLLSETAILKEDTRKIEEHRKAVLAAQENSREK